MAGSRCRRSPWAALAAALLLADPASAAPVDLVSSGATWKYLDDGSDQGSAWRDPAFVDTGWSAGPSQLGYGDGDEATVVASGPDGAHFITTWFRHSFDVADPTAYGGLTLEILRDAGAVVYLNGTEVFRTNMPAGTIDHLTRASSNVNGAAEDAFHATPLEASEFVVGDNVLAVEVHLRSPTVSDMSFDLRLVAIPVGEGPGLLRGPYLQLGTPGSLFVRWRTILFSSGRVDHGPAPSSLPIRVTDPTLSRDHEVEITGLAPFTRYYYAVGSDTFTVAGGDPDHFFVTSPTPGTRQPLRIWVIGDSGQCGVSQQGCDDATAVADAYLNDPGGPADVWLMLGDNAYQNGTDAQYTKAVFETYPTILRSTMLWAVPGNHEFHASDSATGTGPYYEAFTLPTAAEAGGVASGTEAYYSFDYANVHFIALDSHDTDRSAPANPTTNVCPPGEGGAMYQWLCADLAATGADWVIAFWHHPPYTNGSHNSDLEAQLIEMRERFVPVLESFGVDLQLTGHSHSYERSLLIDAHYGLSGTFGPQHTVDGGDGDPDGDGAYVKATLGTAPHEGAVYAVVGSSSKNSGVQLSAPMTVAINLEGSLLIDIDGNVLDGTWIDKLEVVGDRFRIVKGSVSDEDGDGIPDAADNCLELANADQCDGDLDGYGNACDADYNDDGLAGIQDFNAFRAAFGQSVPPADPELDHVCDGAIGVPDFNAFRSLFGTAPGPSGRTCAGVAPCPAP